MRAALLLAVALAAAAVAYPVIYVSGTGSYVSGTTYFGYYYGDFAACGKSYQYAANVWLGWLPPSAVILYAPSSEAAVVVGGQCIAVGSFSADGMFVLIHTASRTLYLIRLDADAGTVSWSSHAFTVDDYYYTDIWIYANDVYNGLQYVYTYDDRDLPLLLKPLGASDAPGHATWFYVKSGARIGLYNEGFMLAYTANLPALIIEVNATWTSAVYVDSSNTAYTVTAPNYVYLFTEGRYAIYPGAPQQTTTTTVTSTVTVTQTATTTVTQTATTTVTQTTTVTTTATQTATVVQTTTQTVTTTVTVTAATTTTEAQSAARPGAPAEGGAGYVTVVTVGTTTYIAVKAPKAQEILNVTLNAVANRSGVYVYASKPGVACLYNGAWYNSTGKLVVLPANASGFLCWAAGQGPIYVAPYAPATWLAPPAGLAAYASVMALALAASVLVFRRLEVAGAVAVIAAIVTPTAAPLFGIPPSTASALAIFMFVIGVLLALLSRQGE